MAEKSIKSENCWNPSRSIKAQNTVMFRIALTALMMLQSLTGPNPCCCTRGRMAAMTMSWTQLGGDHGIQSSSCCESQNVSESGDDQRELQSCCRPTGSRGPTKHCKCQKSRCNAVPSPSTSFTIDLNRSWLDDLASTLATPLMPETGDFFFFAMVVYPDGSLPATRSGLEIRVALQSWQC